uniref:Tr-type G domain-containing protein n=1 Tax=Chromera velia CCMP2878 TaxID=1169474 RepID=A0A0G4F7N4_9ALVE|eukprot:Cvel_15444.t1-p1 / transcript=Cvel_15444.t1 / gene=Cvel_15444 / organism=Chromera_velia_CCMP2878 / gene_product=Elongation factor 2, putative / transcript_product=Elongation factor 2, putative / location=Cvel_scaffold1143:12277-13869(-) / protein_length=531 / sequence_SO=supercontig / SO=protein_coding / is_pseudo=false
MPEYARDNPNFKADLFHIDGDHQPENAKADLVNALRLARPSAVVIFDDICFSPLKAVWTEALQSGLLSPLEVEIAGSSRQGVACFSRSPQKGPGDLFFDLSPVISHRGRIRNVIVLAPTDHGQDSLLGYLTRHRSWTGVAVKNPAGKSVKLEPNSTERHQSPWLSLPLRFQPSPGLPTPYLVHLTAPPFYATDQIEATLPLLEGALLVVDCAEGLTAQFRTQLRLALAHRIRPVLLMNKIDKLQALVPDDEDVYMRLTAIISEVSDMMESHGLDGLDVRGGQVVFGRGSLSVAESIGGWGFTLRGLLEKFGASRGWDADRVTALLDRAWGDQFFKAASDGRRATGVSRERGFCLLVLRPLRDAMAAFEAGDEERAAVLGAQLRPELGGNARRHWAMESWIPLADVLLNALVLYTPPPRLAGERAERVFYAARRLRGAGGKYSFSFGREIGQDVLPEEMQVQDEDAERGGGGDPVASVPRLFWLNCGEAVPFPEGVEISEGALVARGYPVDLEQQKEMKEEVFGGGHAFQIH